MSDKINGPTATDAQLVMQLYDLRRETEMRKARDWATLQFSPKSFQDVSAIFQAAGSDENRWLRQFITYYEMAGSFVNRGVLNRDLLEDSVGEYVNVYVKLKPYLKELREVTGWPDFMVNIEHLVEESERGRQLMKVMETWFADRAPRPAMATKQSA